MEKIYVDRKNNRREKYLLDLIRVGSKVIVIDGSFMMDSRGNHINGLHFIKNNTQELLTVTEINTSFITDYHSDVLGYHNNCEITGNDGNRYYCSKINIQSFEEE